MPGSARFEHASGVGSPRGSVSKVEATSDRRSGGAPGSGPEARDRNARDAASGASREAGEV